MAAIQYLAYLMVTLFVNFFYISAESFYKLEVDLFKQFLLIW